MLNFKYLLICTTLCFSIINITRVYSNIDQSIDSNSIEYLRNEINKAIDNLYEFRGNFNSPENPLYNWDGKQRNEKSDKLNIKQSINNFKFILESVIIKNSLNNSTNITSLNKETLSKASWQNGYFLKQVLIDLKDNLDKDYKQIVITDFYLYDKVLELSNILQSQYNIDVNIDNRWHDLRCYLKGFKADEILAKLYKEILPNIKSKQYNNSYNWSFSDNNFSQSVNNKISKQITKNEIDLTLNDNETKFDKINDNEKLKNTLLNEIKNYIDAANTKIKYMSNKNSNIGRIDPSNYNKQCEIVQYPEQSEYIIRRMKCYIQLDNNFPEASKSENNINMQIKYSWNQIINSKLYSIISSSNNDRLSKYYLSAYFKESLRRIFNSDNNDQQNITKEHIIRENIKLNVLFDDNNLTENNLNNIIDILDKFSGYRIDKYPISYFSATYNTLKDIRNLTECNDCLFNREFSHFKVNVHLFRENIFKFKSKATLDELYKKYAYNLEDNTYHYIHNTLSFNKRDRSFIVHSEGSFDKIYLFPLLKSIQILSSYVGEGNKQNNIILIFNAFLEKFLNNLTINDFPKRKNNIIIANNLDYLHSLKIQDVSLLMNISRIERILKKYYHIDDNCNLSITDNKISN